jgi:hypothetical protein
MREHGGIDAYTQHVREWWAWRKDQSETQRKDRTLLLSALVRVLSQSDDHDWASAIPQGLFLAAARATRAWPCGCLPLPGACVTRSDR